MLHWPLLLLVAVAVPRVVVATSSCSSNNFVVMIVGGGTNVDEDAISSSVMAVASSLYDARFVMVLVTRPYCAFAVIRAAWVLRLIWLSIMTSIMLHCEFPNLVPGHWSY